MRTNISEKSLFGFLPMEYDFLKAKTFWLWAALIFSYIERNKGKMDISLLSSEWKLDRNFVVKRTNSMVEKWLLLWVWKSNDMWIYKQYKIHNDVLILHGKVRIRK